MRRSAILKQLNLFLLIFLLSISIFTQSNRSIIRGKILSDEGIVVQRVNINASSSELMGVAVTVSDKKGVYLLFNLPPGTYTIKYECEGFRTIIKKNVFLNLEQTLNMPVKMVSMDSNIVDKKNDKIPTLDVKSTLIKKTIQKATFDKLPKGRDFSSIISIVPGVTNDASLSGISIGGASGAENRFYIDGVDVTSFRNGTQGQSAVFDFIEYVNVKTGGFSAEYGGAPGGVISTITRSGGNEFHGDIFGYFSGSTLNGTPRDKLFLKYDEANVLSSIYWPFWPVVKNITEKEKIMEAGFSLGGYIIKDKLWFFGSFIPRFNTNKNDTTTFAGSHELYTTKKTWMNYIVKLSAKVSNSVRFSASYLNNFYNVGVNHNITWGELESESREYDKEGFELPNYSASAALDINISNNSILNLGARTFFTNKNKPKKPIPTLPLYRFYIASGSGVGTSNIGFEDIPNAYKFDDYWSYNWGSGIYATVKNIAEHKTVSLDYTQFFHFAGEHSLKFGIQYVRQKEDVNSAYQQPVISLAWDRELKIDGKNKGRGKYGYYSVLGNDITGAYGSVYKAQSNRISLYLQDSWTIGERLTLNYGIRAESEYVPSYSDNPDLKDKNQIEFNFGDKLAPRIGFVYDVKGDSTFKIFGSYGLFFDVLNLDIIANSIGINQGVNMNTAYYTLDIYEFDKIGINNYYPGTLLGTTGYNWHIPSVLDPDLKPMSERVISFGLETQLTQDILAVFRVTNKHLKHGINDVINFSPEGRIYYTGNPGFGLTLENYSDHIYPERQKSKREYWEVSFSIDKKFSNNWMAGVSYTWSRLTGNYSGFGDLSSLPEDQFYDSVLYNRIPVNYWYTDFDKNLNPIEGPLPTDRTHNIKAYGSYVFPFGLTLGTVFTLKSGTPVTEEWYIGATAFYPNNRGNLGRTPMFYNADLYAEYNLKLGKTNLQFNINITNVFNFKIAQNIWERKTLYNLYLTEVQLLSANWEYPDYIRQDPRYLKAYNYNDPISARVGLKLSF